MRSIAAVCAVAVFVPTALGGQNVAVAPHLGSLGFGVDGAYAVSDVVSIRAGFNFQPYSPEPDLSDVTFKLNLPSPSLTGMVDLHPGGGTFRVSVGAIYFVNGLELDAVLNEDVEIGDETYTPAELGTLTGALVTNSLAPYVGIGVGNAATGTTGFFLDVGAAFHGTPEVELAATGSIATDPEFQSELEQERAEIEDDASSFKAYPVITFGFRLAVR